MNTPIEVVSVGQISGGFTNLPVMWLPNRWVFLRGELPGVTGRLAQEVVFDWTGVHASLAAQLKWAIATRCLRGEWCAQTLLQARTLMRHLMPFLRQDASGVASALDRDLETWQIQLRSHLLARGTYRPYTLPALVRSAPEGAKNYTREDPKVRLFRQLYGMIAEELDPRNEYDKDVWNLRRLGIAGRASATINYLNFTRIGQPWLKEAIKRYCQYTLVRGAPSNCHEWIVVANRFSEYLAETRPDLVGSEMHRAVLLGFVPFLERIGYTRNRGCSAVLHLRTILEYCGREGWGGLPNRALLYRQDLPPRIKAIPRFIPDQVLRPLNAHLDDLPEDQQRMLLVIQEVGMRGGELCEAPFDCLLQDNDGDYFFLYYQGKMRKEHHVPITRELAKVVKEQQSYMRERFTGQSLPYLFMTRRSQPYKRGSLAVIINSVAHKHDIRGAEVNRSGSNRMASATV